MGNHHLYSDWSGALVDKSGGAGVLSGSALPAPHVEPRAVSVRCSRSVAGGILVRAARKGKVSDHRKTSATARTARSSEWLCWRRRRAGGVVYNILLDAYEAVEEGGEVARHLSRSPRDLSSVWSSKTQGCLGGLRGERPVLRVPVDQAVRWRGGSLPRQSDRGYMKPHDQCTRFS
jgi:hypothetical protein